VGNPKAPEARGLWNVAGGTGPRVGSDGSAYQVKKKSGIRHWRKMTWLVIVWCTAIIVWAMVAAGNENKCVNETNQVLQNSGLSQSVCTSNAAVSLSAIFVIGFIGFVFFALIWFMTRPRGRTCPVCGAFVKQGATSCSSCGYDYAARAGHRVGTA
jgi:hypothetical protein